MAETKTLAATVRSGIGKGAARSVRREGRIPGVIYGGGDPAEPIALDYRELNKLIYAGHFLTTLFEIDVDGAKQRVIPRDYQLDPVKDQPLHVDFLRLKPGASLRVEVPVHFINQDTCPGVKKGGSVNIVRHSIEMRVPADDIPEAVIADLGALDINDSLHLTALPLPAGCKPTLRDRDFTIVTITPPAVVPEDAAAAAAAAAAPAKGKAGAKAPAAAAPAAAPAKKK
ncbi:50S ribosomal protein L25/general stress protein Ctc [Methylocella tundrae]|uniref:Large ribosomal subunit protein bL25 n=1 Tax=Methylocella tundrae TaxID=227605 RepID=A0A4U8Z4F5_METTU|nr:50S ribosomal protein L25/general stress protein Ctc [Methylocella tundrae]WPP04123.1 50S ribosomal protein L25/general stress protein Ctc [Methylocella tundrae]VFU10381.1 50S ribosomal protein L25 [Methylocella tundrae]